MAKKTVAEIDQEIEALQIDRERALAEAAHKSKYPPPIVAVLSKWIGNDFDSIDGDGDEVKIIKVVNGDIAILLAEIDRLMAEVKRLHHELNGKREAKPNVYIG